MITWISNISQLWDFFSVKLATLASILGTIGFGLDKIEAVPKWLTWTCQICGLLITTGIIPARGIKQISLGPTDPSVVRPPAAKDGG